MKTNRLQRVLAAVAATSLTLSAATALAQDAPALNAVLPAAANLPAPNLGYATSQVLQLAQARLGDATIIAYIRNSGNSYGLNADQIIYLRQQGLSDAVITTMLSQPRAGAALTLPTTPAPAPVASTTYAGQASTATVAPSVAYEQTLPAATYYSDPYYYDSYYYYPGYAWYPPVTIGWGWGWGGWGWRGGGYYGGYRGGWHGGGFGGGWHGGGFGGGGRVGGFGGGGHGGGHR